MTIINWMCCCNCLHIISLIFKLIFILFPKKLNQIKTKEYKNPYKVHKVPVKSCFLNHFIMATLLKIAHFCFDEHYQIYNNPAEYVKSMKSCNAKEVASKCNRTRGCNHFSIIHYFRAPWIVTCSCSPMLYNTINQNFMAACNKMCPFPGLAT